MDVTKVWECAGRIVQVDSGEQVTIRKLSGGPYRTGRLQHSEGNLLKIRLEADATQPELNLADLVELTCASTLCLGEIQGRQDGFLIVGVEHSVDRDALAVIQQVWYRPESE